MSRRRGQFSMRRLLILVTGLAAAFAIAGGVSSIPLVQAAIALYFGLIAIWTIMRWPDVYAGLKEVRSRRRAILERRQALARQVEQQRRNRVEVAD